MRLLAWQHVISIQDGGCPSLSSTHLLLTTVRRPSEEIQAMADNKCLGLCHDVKQNTWTLSYFFRLVVRKRTDGRQASETTVIIPLIQAPRSVHNNQSSPREKEKKEQVEEKIPFFPSYHPSAIRLDSKRQSTFGAVTIVFVVFPRSLTE